MKYLFEGVGNHGLLDEYHWDLMDDLSYARDKITKIDNFNDDFWDSRDPLFDCLLVTRSPKNIRNEKNGKIEIKNVETFAT